MDISLLRLDLNTKSLEWAGANNPIYIIKNSTKELIEFKANKQPIGFYHEMEAFTNHRYQLEKNDSVYIFSDGFADQFGGEKGKKFMYRPFKRKLQEIALSPLEHQKETLLSIFSTWKGNLEQTDDVCIIGLEV